MNETPVARALATWSGTHPPSLPVAGVCRNPLRGMQARDMHQVAVGVSIWDLRPEHEGVLFCVLNGEPLSRLLAHQRSHVAAIEEAGGDHLIQLKAYAVAADNWHRTRTRPGDVIEWYEQPGRDFVRLLLQVAIAVVASYVGGPAGFAIAIGGNLAVSLLLPPRVALNQQGDPAKSIYATSLNGNQARLDQPIWKVCGRVKFNPPYAAQPYLEFQASDPLNPTVDCDQFWFALMADGIGNVEIEKRFIGKTAVTHFQDVTVAETLLPGEQPSTVLANVTTSQEISASELKHDAGGDGFYVGGIAACRPGDRAESIGVDVAAAQGLGVGASTAVTVEWQVEVREINDFGTPLGEWQIVANESRTQNTNTPQRWSNRYTLITPMRCEVRLVRTNEKNAAADARDGIQWIGLRAYLSREAPLNAATTYDELVMRASEQLNGDSAHDYSVIARGHARTWDPIGGWGAYAFTRNPAWWCVDLLSDADWGLGLDDERIDLQGFYDWAVTLDLRQDHFDFVFTQAQDSWQALQTIARAGRARVFVKNGVYSVARDEWVDLPRSAITPRIAQPKSMRLNTNLPKREQPDGVVVEYQSNVTWDTATIECPCPGFSVSDPENPLFTTDLPPMSNPVFLFLDGITGAKHAEREGIYQAYSMALRPSTVEATIEMEGTILSYMDLVRWMPQIPGYGQAGDVAFWDDDTLVMGLSEPPDFASGPLYLTLVKDDGSLTVPVAVTSGPTANDVTLPAAPDFVPVLDDADRERPKFLLGPLLTCDELAKVASISSGGKSDDGAQLYDIVGVVDVEAVHLADNHLLPGPGDIQDPIDDGLDDTDDVGGGVATLVRLLDHDVEGGNVGLPDDTHRGGLAGFTLFADGTAGFAHADDFADVGSPTTGLYSREWLNTAPVEPAVAALYEVNVDDQGSAALPLSGGATIVGTFNTWQTLDTDRTWSIQADDAVSDALFGPQNVQLILKVRIRRIGTTVIQESRNVILIVTLGSSPP